MAAPHSTELYVATDPRALVEEQPLPELLRDMSLLMRVLCFFALGRPDFQYHWKSLQSEQAFEAVRSRLCSILVNSLTAAGILLATSGIFLTTGTPVPYFDYTSSVPYYLLYVSLMLAMIAMLISGLSMLRWIHAERQWTQKQLKLGDYFVVCYLLSIVTPMFLVAWSLHFFMLAIMIAGFYSQSTVCRAVTALWLVTYIANFGTILMEFMLKYATGFESR